ncbi:hypothetical protein B0H14DRAFT_3001975 [Mycena olivaceomarginata]|nr:hypothetical protein B0H14DRAFT_3001975 [Mycena olivaceomarginata]
MALYLLLCFCLKLLLPRIVSRLSYHFVQFVGDQSKRGRRNIKERVFNKPRCRDKSPRGQLKKRRYGVRERGRRRGAKANTRTYTRARARVFRAVDLGAKPKCIL